MKNYGGHIPPCIVGSQSCHMAIPAVMHAEVQALDLAPCLHDRIDSFAVYCDECDSVMDAHLVLMPPGGPYAGAWQRYAISLAMLSRVSEIEAHVRRFATSMGYARCASVLCGVVDPLLVDDMLAAPPSAHPDWVRDNVCRQSAACCPIQATCRCGSSGQHASQDNALFPVCPGGAHIAPTTKGQH